MRQKLLKREILLKKALYCFLTVLIAFPLNLLVTPITNATTVISQANWTLQYVDSEELVSADQRGEYAFDGDVNTFWHSEWLVNNPDATLPHEIQIDLGFTYDISGFRYLPRTDGGNGNIKEYKFYVSKDTTDWGDAVATGMFPIDTSEQEVLFSNSKIGRYIKLEALSSEPDSQVTVVRELNVIGEEAPSLADAQAVCDNYANQGKTVVMFPNKLIQPAPIQAGPVQADIPAGVYEVKAVSHDGYPSRSSQSQLQEQWYAILNDSSNNDIATTGTSSDLSDGIDYAMNDEVVNNNLTVSADVASVTAYHAGNQGTGPNSVYPVCAVFEKIVPPANPAIAITKIANPTSLPVGGGDVIYTYEVSNPGNVDLESIVLTDDKCSAVTYVSGDSNVIDTLETTETWIYTCEMNITVDTTNIATVEGIYNSQTVGPVTAEATVTVETPSQDDPIIAITKIANPTSLPVGGGNVDYTYVVTNPGDVALADIKLVDDKLGELTSYTGDDNSDDILDLTETWTYTQSANITANTTNVATVEGYHNTQKVEATANASVSVSSGGGGVSYYPAIRIIKTPEPRTLPVGGGEVIYTYEVTNPGHYALSNVTLVDDKCDGIEYKDGDKNTNDKLDRGEIWEYTCQSNLTETTLNTVVVTGESVKGNVTDTTTATVTVPTVDLAIRLEKTANPESLPEGGGLVVYSYEVYNEGIKAISDVTLVDDKCSPVIFVDGDINSDNKLDPTEVWKYSCESNITKTTTNIGTVRGQVDGKYATDTDDAIVRVEKVKGTAIIPKEMPKTGRGEGAVASNNWQQILLVISAVMIVGIFRKAYRERGLKCN